MVNQCLRDVLDQILHRFISFVYSSKQQHPQDIYAHAPLLN
jgi:hypothetical protein